MSDGTHSFSWESGDVEPRVEYCIDGFIWPLTGFVEVKYLNECWITGRKTFSRLLYSRPGFPTQKDLSKIDKKVTS